MGASTFVAIAFRNISPDSPNFTRMTRKLKYHEQKLLKKVDFVNWKQDNNHRDHQVSRRYMIQKPEDYRTSTRPSPTPRSPWKA